MSRTAFARSEFARARRAVEASDGRVWRAGWSLLVLAAALVLPPEKYNTTQEWTRTLRIRARSAGHEVHLARLWLDGLPSGVTERIGAVAFEARLVASRLMHCRPRDQDVFIRVRGTRYSVSLGCWELGTLHELYHEAHHSQLAAFVPKPGWTVVDVGANVGMYAIMQAGMGAVVIALEPNPDCYRRLCATLAANTAGKRVTPLNFALGARSGSGVPSVPIAEGSPATPIGTVERLEPDTGEASVAILTLDVVRANLSLDRIDLLKIDVEGAERDVLVGARETLRRVERVVLEYHSANLLQEVTELLHRNGFEVVERVDVDRNADVGLLYAERRGTDPWCA